LDRVSSRDAAEDECAQHGDRIRRGRDKLPNLAFPYAN
jgi:hypothetical protein